MRHCEAPYHVEGCSGKGETKDHFTPKCIAHLWGWTSKQINDPQNIQYLSKSCHEEKDSTTPFRLDIARHLESGGKITLTETQTAFRKELTPGRHTP